MKDWVIKAKRGLVDPFVLDEGGDSGYRTKACSCIVNKWKQKNGLKIYTNSASSPDLAPYRELLVSS